MNRRNHTLNVGILGTGKIGTDLLIKISQSPHLNCALFAGRNEHSEGIKKAKELGVPTSTKSIEAFEGNHEKIELVFDATSAAHHREHAQVFSRLGIKAIDMTPARVGPLCVPLLNKDIILSHDNINMITCGGQSSIPVIEAIAKNLPEANSVTLQSIVSPDSIGQATLDNIDDYYATTASAITEFTGVACTDIRLDLAQDDACVEMTNIIRVDTDGSSLNIHTLSEAISNRIAEINEYVPGYRLIDETKYGDTFVEFKIAVRGQGDWIPEHAGNLDIINCAAIAVAEKYAEHVNEQEDTRSFSTRLKSFLRGKRTAIEAEAV